MDLMADTTNISSENVLISHQMQKKAQSSTLSRINLVYPMQRNTHNSLNSMKEQADVVFSLSSEQVPAINGSLPQTKAESRNRTSEMKQRTKYLQNYTIHKNAVHQMPRNGGSMREAKSAYKHQTYSNLNAQVFHRLTPQFDLTQNGDSSLVGRKIDIETRNANQTAVTRTAGGKRTIHQVVSNNSLDNSFDFTNLFPVVGGPSGDHSTKQEDLQLVNSIETLSGLGHTFTRNTANHPTPEVDGDPDGALKKAAQIAGPPKTTEMNIQNASEMP